MAHEAEDCLGLQTVARGAYGVVLCEAGTGTISLFDGGGVVIGDIFRNGALQCVSVFDPAATDEITRSGGGALIGKYWGEYLAVGLNAGAWLLRDPSGAVPCFYSSCRNGITAFYSDIEIAVRLGLIEGAIDWPALRQWLAYPAWRTEATCIKNVCEVAAGERLTFENGRIIRSQIWSPWRFARSDRQFSKRNDAVEALAEAARHTTRAWTTSAESPLLELSGGIDSSIVAACLRLADAQFECITLWAPQSGEDERQHASRVAEFVGAKCHVVALSAASFDVTDVSRAKRPRPTNHPLKRISDRAIESEAESCQARSFFSGSGGDYVLGSLSSSAPAADALRACGPSAQFFDAVGDVARLHACSVWKVAGMAVKKAVRPPRKRPARGEFLVDGDAIAPPVLHPWMIAPPGALPGKVEHIAALSRSHGVREGRDRVRLGPLRMPLLSQPVIETSLRIPSWMNVTGGRNRAVARDAFANSLPPEIVQRKTKGSFAGLNAAILEHNRARIKDLLLGGRLHEKGILDSPAVERRLAASEELTDGQCSALRELACAELWTHDW